MCPCLKFLSCPICCLDHCLHSANVLLVGNQVDVARLLRQQRGRRRQRAQQTYQTNQPDQTSQREDRKEDRNGPGQPPRRGGPDGPTSWPPPPGSLQSEIMCCGVCATSRFDVVNVGLVLPSVRPVPDVPTIESVTSAPRCVASFTVSLPGGVDSPFSGTGRGREVTVSGTVTGGQDRQFHRQGRPDAASLGHPRRNRGIRGGDRRRHGHRHRLRLRPVGGAPQHARNGPVAPAAVRAGACGRRRRKGRYRFGGGSRGEGPGGEPRRPRRGHSSALLVMQPTRPARTIECIATPPSKLRMTRWASARNPNFRLPDLSRNPMMQRAEGRWPTRRRA